MDLVAQRGDYDQLSWSTRLFVAQKLNALVSELEPYADGSMGDPSAALLQQYRGALRDLGDLFEVRKRPFEKPEAKGVPVEKVQQLLEEQAARFEQRLDAAVQLAQVEALEQARVEFEARERVSLEAGRDAVRRQLEAVLSRR